MSRKEREGGVGELGVRDWSERLEANPHTRGCPLNHHTPLIPSLSAFWGWLGFVNLPCPLHHFPLHLSPFFLLLHGKYGGICT